MKKPDEPYRYLHDDQSLQFPPRWRKVRTESESKEQAIKRIASDREVPVEDLTFVSEEDIENDYDAFADTYVLVPN